MSLLKEFIRQQDEHRQKFNAPMYCVMMYEETWFELASEIQMKYPDFVPCDKAGNYVDNIAVIFCDECERGKFYFGRKEIR